MNYNDTVLVKFDQDISKDTFVSFDLDNTLIATKSGKTFPKDGDDWKWLYPTIPQQLKKISEIHQIIIFSNQKGLTGKNGIKKQKEWEHKLENIYKKLKINLIIMAASDDDNNRKPRIGMMDLLNKLSSDAPANITYNIAKSCYVGDAAGRSFDHSDTDRKFALNCGLKFYVPEEYFKKQKADLPDIKYPQLLKSPQVIPKIKQIYDKELIIMIGAPASGKSTVSKNMDHERVNRDTLNTKAKCIKKVKDLIKNNKNIVIDNTNPDKDSRKIYIDLAKQNGYNTRAIYVKTSDDICMHNNWYRHLVQGGSKIPTMVYRIFNKKLNLKTISDEVDKYEEIDLKFGSDDKQYLTYYY